jgi:hypothetical protein
MSTKKGNPKQQVKSEPTEAPVAQKAQITQAQKESLEHDVAYWQSKVLGLFVNHNCSHSTLSWRSNLSN